MTRIHQTQVEMRVKEGDVDRFFLRLQILSVLEKKSCVFWHRKYFERYIESKIVPWGLRGHISPNLKKNDDTLKNTWEQNLLHDEYTHRTI